MNTSIFLRFLLAPLVALGIVIGLALIPAVLPATPAKASPPRPALATTCKTLLKNDGIRYNVTDTGFFVHVQLGCSAGDATKCGARLYWRIYDESQQPVCGAIPADYTKPCGAAQKDVSWGPIMKYEDVLGNPLEPGWYVFEYNIYRVENGKVDLDNPVRGSEWYEVP